jgi:predicted secreted protein
MDDYIRDLLEEAPKDLQGVAATPTADHLFTINTDPDYLDNKESEFFHHMTAKLLFLCKRARPDIQTAVAFLTTQVKRPDKDNYKKLG